MAVKKLKKAGTNNKTRKKKPSATKKSKPGNIKLKKKSKKVLKSKSQKSSKKSEMIKKEKLQAKKSSLRKKEKLQAKKTPPEKKENLRARRGPGKKKENSENISKKTAEALKAVSVSESNAREAVRQAQQSTLDIIKAAALKLKNQRSEKSEDDSEFMQILTPRRRGRPPKSERHTKKDSHFYEPEFDGLMEEKISLEKDLDAPSASYAQENETIDFWTDDDIPMGRSWRDEVPDF